MTETEFETENDGDGSDDFADDDKDDSDDEDEDNSEDEDDSEDDEDEEDEELLELEELVVSSSTPISSTDGSFVSETEKEEQEVVEVQSQRDWVACIQGTLVSSSMEFYRDCAILPIRGTYFLRKSCAVRYDKIMVSLQ